MRAAGRKERFSRLSTWALAGALVGFVRLASAGVPTRLVYVRSADASACPEQPALEDAVAARLGYNPFSPWGDQTIVATVSRDRGNVVARAELVDHDGIVVGNRQVAGAFAQCPDVIASLALAISITLDPMRVNAAAKPESSPAESEAPLESEEPSTATETGEDASPPPPRSKVEPSKVAPARPALAPRSEQPARSSPFSGRGRVGLLASIEALPQPSPGGSVGFELSYRNLSLGLEAFGSLASSQSAQPGAEVRVSLAALTLAPCVNVFGGLAACATGSFGRLSAEGRGVSDPRADSVLYAAVGGRGAWNLPLGKTFALLAHADLVAALTRPTFQLDGASVWRPAPVAVWLGLGASMRFF